MFVEPYASKQEKKQEERRGRGQEPIVVEFQNLSYKILSTFSVESSQFKVKRKGKNELKNFLFHLIILLELF